MSVNPTTIASHRMETKSNWADLRKYVENRLESSIEPSLLARLAWK